MHTHRVNTGVLTRAGIGAIGIILYYIIKMACPCLHIKVHRNQARGAGRTPLMNEGLTETQSPTQLPQSQEESVEQTGGSVCLAASQIEIRKGDWFLFRGHYNDLPP